MAQTPVLPSEIEAAIARCEREIEICQANQSNPRYDTKDYMGALMGELDWTCERRLLLADHQQFG